MSFAKRSTVVVQGRLAMRHQRLVLAREGRHGVQMLLSRGHAWLRQIPPVMKISGERNHS